MYILSVKSSTEQGAYAVEDEEGKRVIFLFEEEDDAVRSVSYTHLRAHETR